MPGIVFICAGYGSANTAVGIAQDMTNGIIDRFRTMPIKSASVITGHVVASVVRNLVATALVFGVALLVGFDPSTGMWGWLGAIGLISLFIFTFTCLFAAIGLVASTPSAANGYGFILLFLPYVSSAFVPTNTMPSWLQGFAQHQPITPLIESIRGLLMDTPVHNNVWLSLGWCALILLISFTWIIWAFRRRAGRR